MNEPITRPGLQVPDDLRLDASQYSPEIATNLYVDHPEGLPSPVGNSLVVGPMGSGKTMMLRALQTKWAEGGRLEPVYVDLTTWISQLAGETQTYDSYRASPRALLLRDALGLQVGLALVEAAGAFSSQGKFTNVLSLLAEPLAVDNDANVKQAAKAALRRAPARERIATRRAAFTVCSRYGARDGYQI